MSITKNWKVLSMMIRPSIDGLQNVVALVHWSFEAIYTDENGDLISKSGSQGKTYINHPDGAFTDFNSLTEEQVLSWVKSALGHKAIEYEIDTMRHVFGLIYPEPTGYIEIDQNNLPWAT